MLRMTTFLRHKVKHRPRLHLQLPANSCLVCSSLSAMTTASETENIALRKFIRAMEDVYGPVSTLASNEAEVWTPPPARAGHLGRYLWTDAFGVLNFITLYRKTKSVAYLHFASQLIDAVHTILGRTRDQTKLLPGATPEHPLAGGLRIGKEDEAGPDGDGQYHHYLTLWMFALNRMSIAKEESRYNDLAIELAKAIHPAFVVNRAAERPRMRWKMTIDLSRPLVPTEGNLDPVDGYVVFSLLQKTAGDNAILKEEINDYKKIVNIKWRHLESEDPLDLGMMLWTVHWLAAEEPWAASVMERAKENLRNLAFVNRYFEHRLERRLAFREFGTCLGIKCILSLADAAENQDLAELAFDIIDQWEKLGIGTSGTVDRLMQRQGLKPITKVMYAAALLPEAFCRDL